MLADAPALAHAAAETGRPVLSAAQAMLDALERFEPSSLSGDDAARLVDVLARVDKACAAALAAVAARAAQCGAHRRRGFHSPAEWLARRTGVSAGEASASLETVALLEGLPATRHAFHAGALSPSQAHEVARGAAADPSAEAALLQSARCESLRSLRDTARRVRLAAQSDAASLHRRQHAAREFRHFVDDEGMVVGRFRLPPEVGTPIVNRVEAEADRVYRKAYAEGRRETHANYAADALVRLLEGKGTGSATRAELVVVVEWQALVRGHAHRGERCHIPGVGGTTVEVARSLLDDAFLKGVLVDGVEIAKVKHFGRHIPAELRTALSLGEAPALDGVVCVEHGCDRRVGIEFDHVHPKAAGGPVSHDNLEPRCRPHHRDKTARDRSAGWFTGSGGGERGPPHAP